jgi:hypothetical protein
MSSAVNLLPALALRCGTSRVRLNILSSSAEATIREFQIFDTSNKIKQLRR